MTSIWLIWATINVYIQSKTILKRLRGLRAFWNSHDICGLSSQLEPKHHQLTNKLHNHSSNQSLRVPLEVWRQNPQVLKLRPQIYNKLVQLIYRVEYHLKSLKSAYSLRERPLVLRVKGLRISSETLCLISLRPQPPYLHINNQPVMHQVAKRIPILFHLLKTLLTQLISCLTRPRILWLHNQYLWTPTTLMCRIQP